MWKPIASVEGGHALTQQLFTAFAQHPSIAERAVPELVAGSWAPDDRPFRAELNSRFLPNSMIFRSRLSAVVQRWTAGTISRHTHLGFVTGGGIDVTTAAGTTTHRAGDVYVFPRWHWVETKVRDEVDLIHIAISTDRLQQLGIAAPADGRSARLEESPLASELRAVSAAVLETTEQNTHADLVTDRVIDELVSGLILSSVSTSAQSPQNVLQSRALRLIEHVHIDPNVRTRDLADTLNVSVRQLQRAFTEGALSVAGELRKRRASTAIRLLTAPGTRDRPIEEIARLSGFPSAYALRSELARHHNATPSTFRESGDEDHPLS